MIITLTGYMGSGKSSVGRKLSALLGFPFIDLDEYVEHKKGCSIPDIISAEGEEGFRALEAECVRDVIIMRQLTGENLVLSLGGGTLCIGAVRDFILNNTSCVYLKASFDAIRERVGEDLSSRPLFSEELYQKRLSVYEMAEHIVDTEGKTADTVAEEIKLFSVSL